MELGTRVSPLIRIVPLSKVSFMIIDRYGSISAASIIGLIYGSIASHLLNSIPLSSFATRATASWIVSNQLPFVGDTPIID